MNDYITVYRFAVETTKNHWEASPEYTTQEDADNAELRVKNWLRSRGQNSIRTRSWHETRPVPKPKEEAAQ